MQVVHDDHNTTYAFVAFPSPCLEFDCDPNELYLIALIA